MADYCGQGWCRAKEENHSTRLKSTPEDTVQVATGRLLEREGAPRATRQPMEERENGQA